MSSLIHPFLKGNPVYCNCYMRPLREWARVGGVKLLGACAGPPHLSDEPLQAVAPLDLRCRSRGETLKDVFEEDDESAGSTPPTAKPKQRVKCPVNCNCDVSVFCGDSTGYTNSISLLWARLCPLPRVFKQQSGSNISCFLEKWQQNETDTAVYVQCVLKVRF